MLTIIAPLCGSHGLSARRARRTKSSRPEGPQARSRGPEGPKTSSSCIIWSEGIGTNKIFTQPYWQSRPTLHSIDISQRRLYRAKCISDAGFLYLGPCRAHAHSLVIDQLFNIGLFYQLSFETIGQSYSSSIFVCFMSYASRDSSVLLSETEVQSRNR